MNLDSEANILQEQHKNNPTLLSSIRTAWYSFDKYFIKADEVPAYCAATLLHPSRRKNYLERNWEPKWVKDIYPKVQKYWENNFKGKHPAIVDDISIHPMATDKFAQWHQKQRLAVHAADEFISFTENDPCELPLNMEPYEWWLQPQQQKSYPNLSKMAVNILSCPSMSAEPERVFSGARRTISWSRIKLGSKNIEMGECLKSWQRIYVQRDGEYVVELRALNERWIQDGNPEVLGRDDDSHMPLDDTQSESLESSILSGPRTINSESLFVE